MMEGEAQRNHLLTAGILLAIGIAAGAFGAHALEGVLDDRGMVSYETASRYVLVMGAALMGASATGHVRGLVWVEVGVALFSLSIFALLAGRLSGWTWVGWVGPVTPLGGLSMMAGWVLWSLHWIRPRGQNRGKSEEKSDG